MTKLPSSSLQEVEIAAVTTSGLGFIVLYCLARWCQLIDEWGFQCFMVNLVL